MLIAATIFVVIVLALIIMAVMIGKGGDYIIKGVNGEIYPCKPDIFHETYELLGEDTQ